jgi:hypothetical protein
MKLQGNVGQLMVRVMMVRQVSPNHPMQLDNKPG